MTPTEQRVLMEQQGYLQISSGATLDEKIKGVRLLCAAANLPADEWWSLEQASPLRIRIHDKISSRGLNEYLKNLLGPVEIVLDCGGGNLAIASSLGEILATMDSTGTVNALCASASNVILAGCRRRRAVPNALFLFHQPNQTTFGNALRHREAADILDASRGHVIATYARLMGITTAESERLWSVEEDLRFSADEAKARGLVHEIVAAETLPPQKLFGQPVTPANVDNILARSLAEKLVGLESATPGVRRYAREIVSTWAKAHR